MASMTIVRLVLFFYFCTQGIRSLCMEIMPVAIPEEIQLHIFVLSRPEEKNCWLQANKRWKEIGSSDMHNIYALIKKYDYLCVGPKDNIFIFSNAVFDGNIAVAERVLCNNSEQDNFFYEFPERYNWGVKRIMYRYFDMRDIVNSQKTIVENEISRNNSDSVNQRLSTNRLMLSLLNKHIAQKQRVIQRQSTLSCSCRADYLRLARFLGKRYTIDNAFTPNSKPQLLNYALCIAIDKNAISLIRDMCALRIGNFKFYAPIMYFLDLAAVLKRKECFELMVQCYKKMLNVLYYKNEALCCFPCPCAVNRNPMTYLDILQYHSAANPDLELGDYISILKKYGAREAIV